MRNIFTLFIYWSFYFVSFFFRSLTEEVAILELNETSQNNKLQLCFQCLFLLAVFGVSQICDEFTPSLTTLIVYWTPNFEISWFINLNPWKMGVRFGLFYMEKTPLPSTQCIENKQWRRISKILSAKKEHINFRNSEK